MKLLNDDVRLSIKEANYKLHAKREGLTVTHDQTTENSWWLLHQVGSKFFKTYCHNQQELLKAVRSYL